MTPEPSSRPPTSSRAQHADRNVRLDPQGIYGTRSARRQSQLRRRRQFQNGLLWVMGGLAAVALGRWALQPRQNVWVASQTLQLPFLPAGAPLLAGEGDLLFTSQSGGLWHAKTGADGLFPEPRRLWSNAFAPGAAPLVTPSQIFWPGGDGTLAALDSASGRLQWQTVFPSALVARPALAAVEGRNRVVAGDDAGNLAAFDALSGALKWKKALGGALGAGIGVLQAQNGPEMGVLVPLMAGPATRGGLVCLDAGTGAERWRFPGDARSQSAGMALPATLGNRVFWCNDEGAVVCLDGATGRKIWKSFAAPQGAQTEKLVMLRGAPTPVAAAGVVVVGGNDGTLRAFDIAAGQPRWTRELGGAVRFGAQKLSFGGKNALLATGETPAVWVIDASDGGVLRRWTTTHPNSYGVAFTAQNLYALDADGHLQIAPLN